MKKRVLSIIFILFSLLILTSCTVPHPKNTQIPIQKQTQHKRTYTNTQLGIKLELPASWSVLETKENLIWENSVSFVIPLPENKYSEQATGPYQDVFTIQIAGKDFNERRLIMGSKLITTKNDNKYIFRVAEGGVAIDPETQKSEYEEYYRISQEAYDYLKKNLEIL